MFLLQFSTLKNPSMYPVRGVPNASTPPLCTLGVQGLELLAPTGPTDPRNAGLAVLTFAWHLSRSPAGPDRDSPVVSPSHPMCSRV